MSNDTKRTPFIMLDLLQKRTNAEHKLQQKEIVAILQEEYGIECNRKTVADNIELLRDLDYDVIYETGYYLASRQFENEELRLLIDSVLFSKNLTQSQAERLLTKIKGLGDKYFQQELPVVAMLPKGIGWSESKSFMLSVSLLHQAIADKKKVEISYLKYGADLKQHPTGRRQTINPYYLIAANGYYFLMCNYEQYDNMVAVRVDRMKDVVILDDKVKAPKQIKDYLKITDLPKHLAEHIYMFNGPSSKIKIKTTENMMSDLVDWFGKDIQVVKHDDKDIEVVVHCNEASMFYWLLQYGMYVEVLEPQELRRRMKEAVKVISKKYK